MATIHIKHENNLMFFLDPSYLSSTTPPQTPSKLHQPQLRSPSSPHKSPPSSSNANADICSNNNKCFVPKDKDEEILQPKSTTITASNSPTSPDDHLDEHQNTSASQHHHMCNRYCEGPDDEKCNSVSALETGNSPTRSEDALGNNHRSLSRTHKDTLVLENVKRNHEEEEERIRFRPYKAPLLDSGLNEIQPSHGRNMNNLGRESFDDTKADQKSPGVVETFSVDDLENESSTTELSPSSERKKLKLEHTTF